MNKSYELGEHVPIPKHVEVCAECGGELVAIINAIEKATGRPVGSEVEIDCENHWRLLDGGHRYWQSDWQPVRDAVEKYLGAER